MHKQTKFFLRDFSVNIFLLFLSLLFALIVSEIAIGLTYKLSKGIDFSSITIPDELLGYRFIPNSRTKIFGTMNDFVTQVNINSYGFRGPDKKMTMLPAEKRILLFGDSEVFGVGVAESEMLDARAEELLGADIDSSSVFKVINMGMPGTGTLTQEQLFNAYAPIFRPNAVIFFITAANDLEDNVTYALTRNKRGTASKDNLRLKDKILNLNTYRFIKYNVKQLFVRAPLLRKFLRFLRLNTGESSPLVNQWYTANTLEEGLFLMEGAFERINDICKTENITMAILVIPGRVQFDRAYMELVKAITPGTMVEQFYNDERRPQRLIKKFCEEKSIGYIEILDKFQCLSQNEGAVLRYSNDGHLNARGTMEIAKLLVEFLCGDINKFK